MTREAIGNKASRIWGAKHTNNPMATGQEKKPPEPPKQQAPQPEQPTVESLQKELAAVKEELLDAYREIERLKNDST